MKYLTKKEFLSKAKKHVSKKHWKTAELRWEYHQKVISTLKGMIINSILEAGTMGANLNPNSDTIDLDLPTKGWELSYKPTYIHDLDKVPYPIHKKYDVFIALRVHHHLFTDVKDLFSEMQRIANNIIIAVPSKTAKLYINVKNPKRIIKCKKTDTIILIW